MNRIVLFLLIFSVLLNIYFYIDLKEHKRNNISLEPIKLKNRDRFVKDDVDEITLSFSSVAKSLPQEKAISDSCLGRFIKPVDSSQNDSDFEDMDQIDEEWHSEINVLLIETLGLTELEIDQYNWIKDRYYNDLRELLGEYGYGEYMNVENIYYQRVLSNYLNEEFDE